MSKPPVKIKIFIVEDPAYARAGLGKRYQIKQMVFERKTGRTLQISSYGTGYNFKEACRIRGDVLRNYFD